MLEVLTNGHQLSIIVPRLSCVCSSVTGGRPWRQLVTCARHIVCMVSSGSLIPTIIKNQSSYSLPTGAGYQTSNMSRHVEYGIRLLRFYQTVGI